MLKVFKWLWDKAQSYGEQRIMAQLQSMADYHRQQAEIAYLKAKHEPDDPRYEDKMERMMFPKLTPQEHGAISTKLSDFIINYHKQEESIDGR